MERRAVGGSAPLRQIKEETDGRTDGRTEGFVGGGSKQMMSFRGGRG